MALPPDPVRTKKPEKEDQTLIKFSNGEKLFVLEEYDEVVSKLTYNKQYTFKTRVNNFPVGFLELRVFVKAAHVASVHELKGISK